MIMKNPTRTHKLLKEKENNLFSINSNSPYNEIFKTHMSRNIEKDAIKFSLNY